MDTADALRELRKEILEIIEFHQDQYRRASGPPSERYQANESYVRSMKLYNKYAILIYSDSLRAVEMYLEALQKV